MKFGAVRNSLKSRRYQTGQSMAEYAIVTTALFSSLYMMNEGCPEYDNCIQKLQVAMHDQQGGFSASISAVHKYGEFAADTHESEWGNGDDDDGSGSSPGGGNSGNTDQGPSVQEQTVLTTTAGTIGTVQSDGTVLDTNGQEIGVYDEASGLYVGNDGYTVRGFTQNFVVDESGNIVYLTAVTSCSGSPPDVFGFVYPHRTGIFFSNTTTEELDFDADAFCYAPAFNTVALDGSDAGGSIVNGFYYTNDFTTSSLSDTGIPHDGEVVYAPVGDSGFCAGMVLGWDDDITADDDLDDDEKYAARLARITDPDYVLGYLDASDYADQVANAPTAAYPNDCVSSRTLTAP